MTLPWARERPYSSRSFPLLRPSPTRGAKVFRNGLRKTALKHVGDFRKGLAAAWEDGKLGSGENIGHSALSHRPILTRRWCFECGPMPCHHHQLDPADQPTRLPIPIPIDSPGHIDIAHRIAPPRITPPRRLPSQPATRHAPRCPRPQRPAASCLFGCPT